MRSRKALVTKGAFYHHFKNKKQLSGLVISSN
ncbi:TetR family transcriptional regulator [Escherichia coli]